MNISASRFQLLFLLISARISQCLVNAVDYRFFIAGGTCAAFSHGITCPIDVVKTKIQANPKRYKDGMLAAANDIIQREGAQVLLGGLGPTVAGYGIEGAAKFGVYEILKPIFGEFIADQPTAFILASIAAGAIAALILCPAESVRIKIVTDRAYSDKGLLTGLPKLIEEEGLFKMFGGFPAMIAKQVPYTMAKQVSFDLFASLLYSYFKDSDVDMKWVVSVSAAAMASVLACIFSQPGDMILTETYKRGTTGKGGTEKLSSFAAVVQRIWGRGGLSEFFVGTEARLVHVGGIITSQLVIYDIVKQMLGLPATGSH